MLIATAGLFLAVAIWGVIDAIHYHQPEVPLADDAAATKVARRPPSSAVRFTLSPGGLGAAWTF